MKCMLADFFTAIKKGNLVEVQKLVTDDPSLVDAFDGQGQTAVLTAAYYQKSEISQFLVEQGATLTLFEACAVGKLERVQALLHI